MKFAASPLTQTPFNIEIAPSEGGVLVRLEENYGLTGSTTASVKPVILHLSPVRAQAIARALLAMAVPAEPVS